ncbi:MAG: hypothetical protein IPL67_06515 [Ignavibacteria bacterium]|nr:hypothetical protein [Ignavibacteria bacterium]
MKIENGKWKIENGKWKMENGKWKVESGKWRIESGEFLSLLVLARNEARESSLEFLPLLVLARINNISDPNVNFPAGETPPAEIVLDLPTAGRQQLTLNNYT